MVKRKGADMRKLGMVLVLLLAPSFACGLSWSFGNNQGLYFDTAPGTFEHGILTEIGVANIPSPFLIVARAENPDLQNSPESDKPEEEEADSGGSWAIGEMQLTTQSQANPPLKVRSAGSSSLNSYNFVGKVGGVSFEQVATPATELAAKSIQLSYDQEGSDGEAASS